jgi:DNA-binding GntR family transcriptional regulator
MAKIQQFPLRNQVRDRIADQLWTGAYSFGDDLNEARLATELGVSRTPLREGLLMLASEGLIVALPNRGFHVPAADANAVAELYPILGSLESLAIQTATGDLRQLAKDLERINRRILNQTATYPDRNKADANWHERLISNCQNETLRRQIGLLRSRSRGIDGALLRGMANAEGSGDQHTEIARLLSEGETAAAAEQVNEHWLKGIDVVTSWIDEKTSKSAVK